MPAECSDNKLFAPIVLVVIVTTLLTPILLKIVMKDRKPQTRPHSPVQRNQIFSLVDEILITPACKKRHDVFLIGDKASGDDRNGGDAQMLDTIFGISAGSTSMTSGLAVFT